MKSATPLTDEKVKFPTPPEPEKVKSESAKPAEILSKAVDKVVTTKERKDKEEPPVSLSSHNGAHAPEGLMISPEMMRKFGLRYNLSEWPPPRRAE